ncbi:hypothetical protein IT072_04415 [Leifsonia sp. ZF2019]|uniref:hypothetical protein n=1 Tax=Leifsonia sp. ZF2019 TaxID=2781978 RepID=UPI001CBF52DA|nr:hypothetical protein [Leifsonia sp. ZF2019]UAJ80296.1 hypothetical protein IT072_04415 [Leifsonia sp. ZF2019]
MSRPSHSPAPARVLWQFAIFAAIFELAVFVTFALLESAGIALVAVVVSIPLAMRFADTLDVRLGQLLASTPDDLEAPLPRSELRACVAYPLIDRPDSAPADFFTSIVDNIKSNPHPLVQHVVVFDLVDSNTELDQADIDRLVAIEAAFESHCRTEDPNAALLVRARKWSVGEGRWIGPERKRGKLDQLIAELADGRSHGEYLLRSGTIEPAAVIVTVDDGARLHPGAVAEMADFLLHPSNKPVVVDGVVEAGFGAVQPGMTQNARQLAKPKADGRFARYGVGTFVGQGAFNVDAYVQTLRHSIPSASVLSHDKLEGYHLRAARYPRVLILDAPSPGPRGVAVRNERWVRGDIQLLPWAVGSTSRSRTRLPPLFRWWLWKDIIKTFEPLSSVLLMVIVVTTPTAFAVQVAAAAVAMISYRSEVLLLLLRPRSGGIRSTIASAAVKWSEALLRAAENIGALVTATVRMATKRRLLEWRPSVVTARVPIRILFAQAFALVAAVTLSVAEFGRGNVVGGIAFAWWACVALAGGIRTTSR